MEITENNSQQKVWDLVLGRLVTVDDVKHYTNQQRKLVGKRTPVKLAPGADSYISLSGKLINNPTHVWTDLSGENLIHYKPDAYVIDGDYLYERSNEEQTERRNNNTLNHLSLSGADRFHKKLEDWKQKHPVQNFMCDLPAHAATAIMLGGAYGDLPGFIQGGANLYFGYNGAKNLVSEDGVQKTWDFFAKRSL